MTRKWNFASEIKLTPPPMPSMARLYGWHRKPTLFVISEPDPLIQPKPVSDPTRVISPVSGLIREISIAVGDTIKQGQTIAVVEAMKMETKLQAVMSGKINAVYFATGDQVQAGDVVAEISD